MKFSRNDYENLKKYMELIINNLPGAVYWKDKEGRYIGCNMHVAKMAGFDNIDDLIGKTDFDLCWKEFASDWRMLDEQVMKANETIVREEKARLANGDIITELTYKTPLINANNEIVGIIGTSLDITDRKKIEQDLIDAIQSKSTFLSIASHEIKGPLTNSIYILKSVKEALANNNQSKLETLLALFDAQIQDSQRGVDTINFLLDFLNLDLTGESLKEPHEIAIGSRIIEIIDEFERNNTKDIRFDLINDSQLPRIIYLPSEIDKIVKILIANAVKYSKKHGNIDIRLNHSVENHKKYITISVVDNGIGINKDALDRFFIPLFFKGKDRDRIYTAPAIKLSYIKKFVESVSGNLAITSEEGVGTAVSIIVPYEKSLSDYQSMYIPDTWESKHYKEKSVSLKKLNFLIVEDNPVTLKILKNEITDLGHQVDAVSNAQDAVKKANQKSYEVIFLDISLPGIDGVELKNILNKENKDLPIVIAVTSHDSMSDRDYFLDKGFATVIGKPFSKEDLSNCMKAIQKYLDEIGY